MFLLIDGSSLLTTNFMANLPDEIKYSKDEDRYEKYADLIEHTADGTFINGLRPTVEEIMEIVNLKKPEYIVVALDKTRDTFRRKLYPAYKAQREEKPDALKQQFIMLEKILTRFGILVLSSDRYEADDILGSIAKRFKNPFTGIKILTKDHDYLQLKQLGVDVWIMQTSEEKAEAMRQKYHIEKVEEWMYTAGNYSEDDSLPCKAINFTDFIIKSEHGVDSSQIVELKAIMGDPSDNIPGIKGIGPKTAASLLSYYKGLDEIYEAVEACDNDPAIEKNLADMWKQSLGIKRNIINTIKENKTIAYLSRYLATIFDDVPVPDDIGCYGCYINKDEYQKFLNWV